MAAANWHAYRSFSRDRSVTHQRLRKGIVRRVASYARPYRWTLALFLLCTCVTAVFTVAVALLLKKIIDQGILKDNVTVVYEVAGLVAAHTASMNAARSRTSSSPVAAKISSNWSTTRTSRAAPAARTISVISR